MKFTPCFCVVVLAACFGLMPDSIKSEMMHRQSGKGEDVTICYSVKNSSKLSTSVVQTTCDNEDDDLLKFSQTAPILPALLKSITPRCKTDIEDLEFNATLHPTSSSTATEDEEPTCPENMKFDNSTCPTTCGNPYSKTDCNVTSGQSCICLDGFYLNKANSCVAEENCDCYIPGFGIVAEGTSFVNSNCSRRYSCTFDSSIEDEPNEPCGFNASCTVGGNSSHECSCKPGFIGDGRNCVPNKTDCYDHFLDGASTDGVYTIYPTNTNERDVYCIMESNGGGWTVFQRRVTFDVSFYRTWDYYKNGFGKLEGDHWLGNDIIHFLTNQRNYSLWIDLWNRFGERYHANYSFVRVAGEGDQYRLQLGSYGGTATYDAMMTNSGKNFSTYDRDNDGAEFHCARKHLGGWWYHSSHGNNNNHCTKFLHDGKYTRCSKSNLNGDFSFSDYRGKFWNGLPMNSCNVKYTVMRIRPIPHTA